MVSEVKVFSWLETAGVWEDYNCSLRLRMLWMSHLGGTWRARGHLLQTNDPHKGPDYGTMEKHSVYITSNLFHTNMNVAFIKKMCARQIKFCNDEYNQQVETTEIDLFAHNSWCYQADGILKKYSWAEKNANGINTSDESRLPIVIHWKWGQQLR